MNVLRVLFNLVRNKYVVTTLVLVVWLLFFDKNDFFSQMALHKQVKKLEAEKKYYSTEIRNNLEQQKELKTNKKTLEKFARENYLMKRDNEDIFVIVRQPK